MAEIFGVSTDEIISGKRANGEFECAATAAEPTIVVEAPKPVLALCEKCNKPLYETHEIHRRYRSPKETSGAMAIYCKDCAEKKDDERFEVHRKEAEQKRLDRECKQAQILKDAKNRRIRGYVFGGLLAAILLIICLINLPNCVEKSVDVIILSIVAAYAGFAFVSCLFLANNFIADVLLSVAKWGAVRFPGLIFSFDLDGIMWLIGMKILFAILGFLIGLAAICLALIISLALSAFVYPFALVKNIKNPDDTDY